MKKTFTLGTTPTSDRPATGNLVFLRESDRKPGFAEAAPAFRHDVLNGLSIEPRTIPARWLYDRRGSELFEAITALPE
jgi:Histidine-specific methyltransferase, SAM-dependent